MKFVFVATILATAAAVSISSTSAVVLDSTPIAPTDWLKCRAMGDPHYLSFSGLRFNDYHHGSFTMYKKGDNFVQVKQASQTKWWKGKTVVKKLTVRSGNKTSTISIEDSCKPTFTGFTTSLKFGTIELSGGGSVGWSLKIRQRKYRQPKRVCFLNIWIETRRSDNTYVEGFCAITNKAELKKYHDQIDMDNKQAEALFINYPEWLVEARQGCDTESDTYADCLEDFFNDKTIQTDPVCENKGSVALACDEGNVINLLNASYGRHDNKTCPHSAMSNTTCHAASSVEEVKIACQGKATCQVPSSNGVFGDPCVGTYKYLTADYQCVKPVTKKPTTKKPTTKKPTKKITNVEFDTASTTGWTKSSVIQPNGNSCGNMDWTGKIPPATNTFTLSPEGASYGPYGIIPGKKGFLGTRDVTYFRHTVNLDEGVNYGAEIKVAVDNNVKIWLNGIALGDSVLMKSSEWLQPFLQWNVAADGTVKAINDARAVGNSVSFKQGQNVFVFGVRNCGGGDKGAFETSVKISGHTESAKTWGDKGAFETSVKISGHTESAKTAGLLSFRSMNNSVKRKKL